MGFYTPTSITANYVPNQRTKEGGYKWDQMIQKVGLKQQAALYGLNTQYSTTINTAYSNYLLANRGIAGSTMGQGYKEAYKQATQEGLQSDIAQANLSIANVRSQLAQEGAKAMFDISEMQEHEISNLNRVGAKAKQYLEYLGTLRHSDDFEKGYLTEEQKELTIDDMYKTVFNAQPRGFEDDKGGKALSYIEWLESTMKDNEADRMWYQWLYGGGFNQFKEAISKGIKK